MPETKNYLLGYGERLTEPIEAPRRPMKKVPPYTLTEARTRLAPRIVVVAHEIAELPPEACPHNESVAAITLHPSYLTKTFFPTGLFHSLGLEPVGSRPRQVRPDKGAKKPSKKQREENVLPASATADVFVVGTRRAFQRWANTINSTSEEIEAAQELVRIEDVRFVPPAERIRPMRSHDKTPLLEVVLHRSDEYVLEGFEQYLAILGVPLDLDRRISKQANEKRPTVLDLGQADRQSMPFGLLLIGDTPAKIDIAPDDPSLVAQLAQLREDLFDQLLPFGMHVTERG
jgi:hypothetical protein